MNFSILDYILSGVSVILAIALIVLFIQKKSLESDLAECQLNFNTLTQSVEVQNAEIAKLEANNKTLNNNLSQTKAKLKESYSNVALPSERVEAGFDPEQACASYITDLLDNIYERREN